MEPEDSVQCVQRHRHCNCPRYPCPYDSVFEGIMKGESSLFYKCAIDTTLRSSNIDQRLATCLRFVADECDPAVFYLNTDWAKVRVLEELGLDVDNLTASEIEYLRSKELYPPSDRLEANAPPLVYLHRDDWQTDQGPDGKLPVRVPTDFFVLSGSEFVNRAALAGKGMNPVSAILCLASVGIDIMLPNISFSHLADEEIDALKHKYLEERNAYLELVSGVAEEAFDRLREGDFEELIVWARDTSTFKFIPKAREIERAVGMTSKSELRKAGFNFWKNGVPAIGSAIASGGLVGGTTAITVHALRSLVDIVSRNSEKKRLPEVGYALKIAKEVQS